MSYRGVPGSLTENLVQKMSGKPWSNSQHVKSSLLWYFCFHVFSPLRSSAMSAKLFESDARGSGYGYLSPLLSSQEPSSYMLERIFGASAGIVWKILFAASKLGSNLKVCLGNESSHKEVMGMLEDCIKVARNRELR